MSEHEFAEVYALMQDAAYVQFLIFSNVMFAYLAYGYVAAASLKRGIALGITATYSFFMIVPVLAYLQEFKRLAALAARYDEMYPSGFIVPQLYNEFTPIPIMILMCIAWAGSVYYVHGYVRGADGT